MIGLVLALALAFGQRVPTVRLANGVAMPQLLLGTPACGAPSPSQACVDGTRDAVAAALQVGFPGVDSAHHYGNQPGVAAGIAQAGAAQRQRQTPWVTSKIEACNNSFVRLSHCGADTRARFADNLRQLNATAVDLMLLHAPTATGGGSNVYPGPDFGAAPCDCSDPAACAAMQQQWAAVEDLYRQGMARAIGVSNYCVQCLDCLARTATVQPMVNQVQLHTRLAQHELVAYCHGKNMAVTAFCPISGSDLSGIPFI